MTVPLKVFIAYSHNREDRAMLDRLLKLAAPLVRAGKLTLWEDNQIPAGDNWAAVIEDNLKQADVALLLLSADFIASKYAHEVEIPLLMHRRQEGACRIVPVLLRPCIFKYEPYAEADFLPVAPQTGEILPVVKWPNADDAFEQVLDCLQTLAETGEWQLQPKGAARQPSDGAGSLESADQPKGPGFGVTHKPSNLPEGEKYFFGIGINQYSLWNPLNNAVNDMQSLARVLQTRYGYKRENMVFLEDKGATRSAIINQLHKFTQPHALGERDSLLIFFSGHGYLDPANNDGYWAPAEAPRPSEDISAMVPNSTVLSYFKNLKCLHALLISDSCFSGTLLYRSNDALEGGLQVAKERSQKKSRRVLCSSSRDEKSYDGRFKHSPFAEALLSALETNQRSMLTLDEIFSEISENTRKNARQLPEYAPLLEAGDQGGRLVFTLQAAQDIAQDAVLEKQTPETESLPGGPVLPITEGAMKDLSENTLSNLERQGYVKELDLAIQKLQALRTAVLLENNASVKFAYNHEIKQLESRIDHLKSRLSL